MKLLTYDTGAGPRCGVLRGDDVVDVSAVLGSAQPLRDVRALLESGESAVDRVRDALAGNPSAQALPLSGVRLRPPVLQPPTVRGLYDLRGTRHGPGHQGAGRGLVPDADFLFLQPSLHLRP